MAGKIVNPLLTATPPSHCGPAGCTPADCMPSASQPTPIVLGDGRWVMDSPGMGRRTLLKGMSAGALAMLAAACGPTASPTALPATAVPAKPTAAPAGSPAASPIASAVASPSPIAAAAGTGPETAYVFNAGSRDVTLIDVASRRTRETKPLGAAVRWLSNQQTFWDGKLIWTYDFPNNQVQAIGIDPREINVVQSINELGVGPAHSLMVLPDKKTAAINIAGDNVIVVLDLQSKQIMRKVPTGKFPCDFHCTPDGRWAFTPDRDQDTVSMFDMQTWDMVKQVPFPAGSQPYMLRVSPDAKEVWVQTGRADTNVVLSTEDLSTLTTIVTGKGPVTNSWTNDGKYSVVTNSADTFAGVYDAKTYREVGRLNIGQNASNISFAKDGTGFMAVGGANSVAVIDMTRYSVVDQLRAGTNPQGLVIF